MKQMSNNILPGKTINQLLRIDEVTGQEIIPLSVFSKDTGTYVTRGITFDDMMKKLVERINENAEAISYQSEQIDGFTGSTAELEQTTSYLVEKTQNIEQSAKMLEQTTSYLNYIANDLIDAKDDLIETTENLTETTESLVNTSESLIHTSSELIQKTNSLDARTTAVEIKAEDIEERTAYLEDRTIELIEKNTYLIDRTLDLVERADECDERTENLEIKVAINEKTIEKIDQDLTYLASYTSSGFSENDITDEGQEEDLNEISYVINNPFSEF